MQKKDDESIDYEVLARWFWNSEVTSRIVRTCQEEEGASKVIDLFVEWLKGRSWVGREDKFQEIPEDLDGLGHEWRAVPLIGGVWCDKCEQSDHVIRKNRDRCLYAGVTMPERGYLNAKGSPVGIS